MVKKSNQLQCERPCRQRCRQRPCANPYRHIGSQLLLCWRGYWTHHGPTGWYLDLVLQRAYYHNAIRQRADQRLRAFLNRSTAYAEARDPVMAWYRQVKAADWATPADVKRDVRSASILKDGRVVFNIAGNKYRIVVWINYPYRVVYIRFIGTHRQYDAIDAQTI